MPRISANRRGAGAEPRGFVRPAQESDCIALAEIGLRRGDVQELEAVGFEPLEALLHSYFTSAPLCFTMVIGRTPCGMFGVAPWPTKPGEPHVVGAPWLLMTDGVYKGVRQFKTQCRHWINWLHTIYPSLTNFVDVRNEVAHRWLRWCGFEFDAEPVPIGAEGELFYRFWRG